MIFSDDRDVAVGDMIIHTPRVRGNNSADEPNKWVGIVHHIGRDKWGHETAFITWTRKHPYYNEERGESCVNVHNLRREYEVIKRK